MRSGFEFRGFSIVEAENAADGSKIAAFNPPDLVILDLRLPDLHGIETLERLRSWSDALVIVLSTKSNEDEMVCLLRSGANDYGVKPFGMAARLARCDVARQRKEHRLLHILATHVGLVVTHDQLLKEIWTGSQRDNVQYLRMLVRKFDRRSSRTQISHAC